MTTAPELAVRPLMSNGKLFHSPLGLFPFQAECVAQAYFQEGLVGVLDTGLGQTIVSMALAAQLIQDDRKDLVLHIAQRNKIDKSEFPADWAAFTSLDTFVYHGPNRKKQLAKRGVPDVFLTTYETAREDLVRFSGKTGRSREDGPLMDELGLRSKRVLWIFDEIGKLGNRRSKLYRAFEHALVAQRSGPHRPRVLGLSATPMATDFEQPFNIGRIVWPEQICFSQGTEDTLCYAGAMIMENLCIGRGRRLVRHPVRAVDLQTEAYRSGCGHPDAPVVGEGHGGGPGTGAGEPLPGRGRAVRP